MKHVTISTAVLTIAIAISAFGWPLLAQTPDTPERVESNTSAPTGQLAGDASDGQRLYFQTGCYACHGTIGQGGFLAGPKVTPPLLPYAAFAGQLRDPANKMPRYGSETMSDQQVANIYAYLAAIPKPKTAQNVEILDAKP